MAQSHKVDLAASLATEERELVKRLLEFPALVAEATERRAPHAIPTFAIRVADDFHRFYHERRVLGFGVEDFGSALPARHNSSSRAASISSGVDAPELDVSAPLRPTAL